MGQLRAFGIPFALVMTLGAGAWAVAERDRWMGGPVGEPTEVSFDSISTDAGYVRLRGMAHYQSTIKQRTPGGMLTEERTMYLFGFFPELDTRSRAVPVLVRTSRPPDDIVAFEVMTVEGMARPLSARTVPPSTEAMLSSRTDYFFDDGVLLLEATRVVSEDGTWDEP